jgi:two-component system chemotaxis response regulator CheB
VPKDILTEAIIAERVLSDVLAARSLGEQVPYNCPDCGGVLWQMSQPKVMRYRCHTGHAFTSASLLAAQTEKIEETLWITLRMLEERRNLWGAMSKKSLPLSRSEIERARETEVHIGRLREILGTGRPGPSRGASSSRKATSAAQ